MNSHFGADFETYTSEVSKLSDVETRRNQRTYQTTNKTNAPTPGVELVQTMTIIHEGQEGTGCGRGRGRRGNGTELRTVSQTWCGKDKLTWLHDHVQAR